MANIVVSGEIVVRERLELYTFEVGGEKAIYRYVDGVYSGDVDGPADEDFVAVMHANGSQSHYGFGVFTGNVKGRSGTLHWKFEGQVGGGAIEVLRGTGELVGITGSINFKIKPGSTTEFTYSGSLSQV